MDTSEFNLGAAIVKGVIFFLLSFVLGKLGCSEPVAAFFGSVTQDVLDHSNKQPTGASHQIDAEIAEKQRQLNQQQVLLEEQNRQAVELRRLENERMQAAEQRKQDEELRHLESERSELVKRKDEPMPVRIEASKRQVTEYPLVGSPSVRSEVPTSGSLVRCTNCNGSGYFKCARCKGKGLILCGDCRGKGTCLYHGRLMRCQFCGGDGVLFSSCPDCHGFGFIACRECQR